MEIGSSPPAKNRAAIGRGPSESRACLRLPKDPDGTGGPRRGPLPRRGYLQFGAWIGSIQRHLFGMASRACKYDARSLGQAAGLNATLKWMPVGCLFNQALPETCKAYAQMHFKSGCLKCRPVGLHQVIKRLVTDCEHVLIRRETEAALLDYRAVGEGALESRLRLTIEKTLFWNSSSGIAGSCLNLLQDRCSQISCFKVAV